MSKVFISYCRADGTEEAKRLYELLRLYGFETWRDLDNQRHGEEWTKAIDDAIDDSYAMIVIATEMAMASPAVTYEWARALGMGKDGIKILVVQKCKWDSIHQQLRIYHIPQEGEPNLDQRLIDALIHYRNQDGITYVRIPSEADGELKSLAQFAYGVQYGDDVNFQAIGRLFEMDDEYARQILISGLNKREHGIRQRILKLMEQHHFDDTRAIPILKQLALTPTHSNDVIERRRSENRSGAINVLYWMRHEAESHFESELGSGEFDHIYHVLAVLDRLSEREKILFHVAKVITSPNRGISRIGIEHFCELMRVANTRHSASSGNIIDDVVLPALTVAKDSAWQSDLTSEDEDLWWRKLVPILEGIGTSDCHSFVVRLRG